MTGAGLQRNNTALIAQVIGGNRTAFDLLAKRYYNVVLANFVKRHVSFDAAHDLTQQTFMKVYEHIGSYSDKLSSFTTWLYTIANNIYVDYVRDYCRHRHIVEFDESVSDIDQQPTPEEAMIAEQDRAALSRLLNFLRPEYRRIIQLRYRDSYTYEEIANELRMPLGTVKIQLFRAKERLLRLIAMDGMEKI